MIFLYLASEMFVPCYFKQRLYYNIFRYLYSIGFIIFLSTTIGERTGFASEPPPQARNAGYLLNTFSSQFNNGSVDLSQGRQSGFSWYLWSFFGSQAQANRVILNNDGTITLLGDVTGPNGQIATITPAKTESKFVGYAFGGGAYIETVLKFNPMDVISSKFRGWPAFWAMSAEHLTEGDPQWVGQQKGYTHFIEIDFFEYDIVKKGQPLNYYGVNLHDWYGKYKTTCPGTAFCQSSLQFSKVKVQVPNETNFSEYHSYGFLWLPATPEKKGIGRFYFDGNQVSEDVEWEMFSNQQGIPDAQPWKFGIMDKQHLALILGTGPNQPMTVRIVNVWQASDAQNLHY